MGALIDKFFVELMVLGLISPIASSRGRYHSLRPPPQSY